MKGWKKIFQENRPQKSTEVAITISNKSKLVIGDKEGNFTLIKEICEEEITIANKYVPVVRAPNLIKQTLT
jgi:hypothetical protein